jgi:hypothetical protein
MVHEGNVYFEDCYAGDFNPRVSDGDREACWNAWLAHYTRHQPAHRIDYALHRVESLQAGEPPLALPGISVDAVAAPIDTQTEGLATLQGTGKGPEVSTVLQQSAVPVAHGCGAACSDLERVCLEKCQDNVGCQDGCLRDRAVCMGGCY